MIKINIDNKSKEFIKKEHYRDNKKRITKTIEKLIDIPKYKKMKDYMCDSSGNIDEEILKKMLIGTKSDLLEIINKIGVIKLDKKDPFETLYINFTYRVWSKVLLNSLNIRVCPYCNRQYTFSLSKAGIRPDFDHFFPKSRFSYLSISLFNLIPSCSICNSKKANLDTSVYDFYYPYEDECGSDVVFQTSTINNDFSYWTGASDNFDIGVVCRDTKHNTKVNNLNKHLKINLLYQNHKDYVRDIIRNAVIYNDSRIDELLEQFPDLFNSRSEVLNSVFMNFVDEGNLGNRPLSKLTNDIYKEFRLFTNNK